MPRLDNRAIEDASEEGAFSFYPGLSKDELRNQITGIDFQLVQRFLRESRRKPGEWRASFLTGLHRSLFSEHFPGQSGIFRLKEVNYGKRAAVKPEHIGPLFQQLALRIQEHLRTSLSQPSLSAAFVEHVFSSAARDHAEMIRIHPFVDGNGRWARLATSLYIFDCGLECGTIIFNRDRAAYITSIDRIHDGDEPGDLAQLLLNGFLFQAQKRLGGLRPRTS